MSPNEIALDHYGISNTNSHESGHSTVLLLSFSFQTFQIARTRPRSVQPFAHVLKTVHLMCIFGADACRVTLVLEITHSRAHTALQTASGAVQASCIWLHLRV